MAKRNCGGGSGLQIVAIAAQSARRSPGPAGVGSREGPPPRSPRPGKDCAAPGTFWTLPAASERAGNGWAERGRKTKVRAGGSLLLLSPALRGRAGASEDGWSWGTKVSQAPRTATRLDHSLVLTSACIDAHANPVND